MRKRKTRRRRSKKGLRKKLWTIFSKYVRLRDKGVCFTCGDTRDWRQQNAGHFIHNVLDYDEMNIQTQCVRCNLWQHGSGIEYTLRLIDKYGLKKVNDLKKRSIIALAGEVYTDEELQEKIDYYKKKIEELQRKYEIDN